jgi:hypothetical protein
MDESSRPTVFALRPRELADVAGCAAVVAASDGRVLGCSQALAALLERDPATIESTRVSWSAR